jgi:hypothetical protein
MPDEFGSINLPTPQPQGYVALSAVTPSGDVYVTTTKGVARLPAGSSSFDPNLITDADLLPSPMGIAAAPNGDLYVTNNGSANWVTRIPQGGGTLQKIDHPSFAQPLGICVAPAIESADAAVFVANYQGSSVTKIPLDASGPPQLGQITTITSADTIVKPMGVIASNNQDVYVLNGGSETNALFVTWIPSPISDTQDPQQITRGQSGTSAVDGIFVCCMWTVPETSELYLGPLWPLEYVRVPFAGPGTAGGRPDLANAASRTTSYGLYSIALLDDDVCYAYGGRAGLWIEQDGTPQLIPGGADASTSVPMMFDPRSNSLVAYGTESNAPGVLLLAGGPFVTTDTNLSPVRVGDNLTPVPLTATSAADDTTFAFGKTTNQYGVQATPNAAPIGLEIGPSAIEDGKISLQGKIPPVVQGGLYQFGICATSDGVTGPPQSFTLPVLAPPFMKGPFQLADATAGQPYDSYTLQAYAEPEKYTGTITVNLQPGTRQHFAPGENRMPAGLQLEPDGTLHAPYGIDKNVMPGTYTFYVFAASDQPEVGTGPAALYNITVNAADTL